MMKSGIKTNSPVYFPISCLLFLKFSTAKKIIIPHKNASKNALKKVWEVLTLIIVSAFSIIFGYKEENLVNIETIKVPIRLPIHINIKPIEYL